MFFYFLLILIVYFLSSQGQTPFDYFSRLADSFLKGKYWIESPPSWLTELIPAGENKYYTVYPPMPAILIVVFKFIFPNFQQQYLAHILGVGISIIFIKIAIALKTNKKILTWIALLTSFGTITWYMSATGSVWYLGQISSAFFMSLAVFEVLTRKRPFSLGVFLGAMYLSRINTIISLPFFIYPLLGKEWKQNLVKIGLGILPFVLFNFFYNYLRFGTIMDVGYFLLPKILNEENSPWFIHGVANLIYIPNNLKTMFWTFPKFINYFPYIIPSWAGLSIWITTPAFIYSVFASFKDKVNIFAWISILLILFIVTTHGGTGWSQFGYRFAVDFYPLLYFLTLKGVINQNGPKLHHWMFLIISILVNLWGVLFINKFGWVEF